MGLFWQSDIGRGRHLDYGEFVAISVQSINQLYDWLNIESHLNRESQLNRELQLNRESLFKVKTNKIT